MRGDRSPTFGAIDGSGEGRRGFVSTYTTKASKAIRLDDDVYERLRDVKRDDETDSEAVERLLPGGSLLDLAGILEPEKVEEIEEGLADTDAKSKERRRALFGPTVILDASFLLDVMASDGDAIDRAAGIDSNDELARPSSMTVYELNDGVEMSEASVDWSLLVARTIAAYAVVDPDGTIVRKAGRIDARPDRSG